MTGPPASAGGDRRPRPRGFTLIELMISIALVVVLILGVNQVFQATSQAVGTGEAINSALRDGRAVQSTIAADFAGIMPNGSGQTNAPWIAFRSTPVASYNDARDLAGDKDGNPLTVDAGGTGVEGDPTVLGDVISPATYANRNYRVDTLSLFSRGPFQRQTGNPGTFVADMAAAEAWVWYGHLQQPDNATPPVFQDPGAGAPATNPNNVFATQFTLGRMGMLLRQPAPPSSPPPSPYVGYLNDNNGVPQAFVLDKSAPGVWSPPFLPDATFGQGNAAYSPPAGAEAAFTTAVSSRFDLAGTTAAKVRSDLSDYITANGELTWWNNLIGLTANAGTAPARFQANPIVTKPLTSAAVAQAAPVFVKGCSQFIVEYAGDFLTQNPDVTNNTATGYGAITGFAADGELDYTLVQPPGGSLNRATWTKQVKWYGLPRNTSGKAVMSLANGDVFPLYDWVMSAVSASLPFPNPYYGFERRRPSTYVAGGGYDAAGAVAAGSGFVYTCVFGPNDAAPKLIRITVTVVDPTGRLSNGQTYQFVYPVPPQ